MREISLTTDRKTQLVDITQEVQAAFDGANGASAALIYVPHTTAGVTIQEHADPAVARALEAARGAGIEKISTTNDELNVGMRGVNERLGYEPEPERVVVSGPA